MSRVGKQPVPIGDGVSVEQVGDAIRVKGPKGTLSERLPPQIEVTIGDSEVTFGRPDDPPVCATGIQNERDGRCHPIEAHGTPQPPVLSNLRRGQGSAP